MKAQLNGKILLKQYKDLKKRLRDAFGKNLICDSDYNYKSVCQTHNSRLFIKCKDGKYKLAIAYISELHNDFTHYRWMETEELTGGVTSEDSFCINLPCIVRHIFDLFQDYPIHVETDADDIVHITPEYSEVRYKFLQLTDTLLDNKTDYKNFIADSKEARRTFDWHEVYDFENIGAYAKKAAIIKGDGSFSGVLLSDGKMYLASTDDRIIYRSPPIKYNAVDNIKDWIQIDAGEFSKLAGAFSADKATEVYVDYAVDNGQSFISFKIVSEQSPNGRIIELVYDRYNRVKKYDNMARFIFAYDNGKPIASGRLNIRKLDLAIQSTSGDNYKVKEENGLLKIGNSSIPITDAQNVDGILYWTPKTMSKIFSSRKDLTEMIIFEAGSGQLAAWHSPGSLELVISVAQAWTAPKENIVIPKEEPEMTKAKTKPTEKPKEVKPKAKTVTKKPTEKPKEITEVKPKVKQKPAQSEKDIVLTFTPAVMGWNYIPGEKPKASLKHSELGKLISANGIYEAYQNEELKRYRLAFNRRLNEQERKSERRT